MCQSWLDSFQLETCVKRHNCVVIVFVKTSDTNSCLIQSGTTVVIADVSTVIIETHLFKMALFGIPSVCKVNKDTNVSQFKDINPSFLFFHKTYLP